MKTQMTSLLDAVRSQDKKLAEEFMKGDTWSTLEHLIGAHSGNEWAICIKSRWQFFLFFSLLDVIIIGRRLLAMAAIGHVITARTSTAAIHRRAKSAACRVKHLRMMWKFMEFIEMEKIKMIFWRLKKFFFVLLLLFSSQSRWWLPCFTTYDRWQFH